MAVTNTLAYLAGELMPTRKLYSTDTCGQFYKHFMSVAYGPSKISCTIYRVHTPMLYFQNAPVYFATAESYACKMFVKLTPGDW